MKKSFPSSFRWWDLYPIFILSHTDTIFKHLHDFVHKIFWIIYLVAFLNKKKLKDLRILSRKAGKFIEFKLWISFCFSQEKKGQKDLILARKAGMQKKSLDVWENISRQYVNVHILAGNILPFPAFLRGWDLLASLNEKIKIKFQKMFNVNKYDI